MQGNLQDDERQAFEAYLLAGKDQTLVKKALSNLVPGSVSYNYLYFVNLITRGDGIKSEADKEAFLKFTENNKQQRDTFQAKQLKLWNMLKEFDSKPESQPAILDTLVKDYLQFWFEHQKPELPHGIKADESSQDEDESRHTLKSDYFNFSNALIIKKKQEKLNKAIDKLASRTDQNQKDMIKQELVTKFLLVLFKRGDGIWHELDFSQYDPVAVLNAAQNLGQSELACIENESLFIQIGKAFLNFIETDKKDQINSNPEFLRGMTIQQLDKLAKFDNKIKNEDAFIGTYFEKQFCEEMRIENQEIWTVQEKLQNLERLYGLAKVQGLPKAFQLQFLEEILSLGPKNGTYSEEYFRNFIDLLEKHESSIFVDYQEAQEKFNKRKEFKQNTNWHQYCNQVTRQTNNSSRQKIISDYLDFFCEKAGGSLAAYNKDFKQEFLKPIEKKWLVWLAKDGLNSLDQNLISLDFYKSMADSVELSFCPQNKEIFTVEEDVSVQLMVKNIKILHVKVFEFNTETYYKKNLQPFNTAVNLDGLDASESIQHTYDQSGNIRHRESYNFPQLKNRVGLFIVEFMGNGVSARAVIKKGSLSLVHRSTIAGHLVYVLDENKNVCASERTGVWFDGKYYPADKANGRIFIPYSKQELSANIIMINGEFAQLGQFVRKQERYDFSAQFYLHSGSVLVGSNTNVVVRAKLNINGRRAQLNLLKKVQIVLTTYNYIDNLPVTKTFKDLSFSNDKELTVTFQVPPNLRNIDIALSCEIQNATTKNYEKFNANHHFPMLSNEKIKDQVMAMPYLKKANGQYEVSFLGRNGEPAAKQKVNLTFKHRLYKGKKTLTTSLITDKNGSVKLGPLTDVTQITAVSALNNESRGIWTLQHSNGSGSSYWSYPKSEIEMIEGDRLELPVSLCTGLTTLDRKWLSLTHSQNNLILNDCFDQVKLEEQSGYHHILVDNLLQGTYKLSFVSGNESKTFTIKVHKGKEWQGSEGFILKKNCLQENVQSASMLRVQNVSVTSEKGPENSLIEVQVTNCSGPVHLHAFAHQFLPYSQTELFELIQDLQTQNISTSSFPFAKWENIYQSNRQMADEIRYVFDRKQLQAQLGNTLDRPTLLNKRNFVRNTTTDAESLHEGGAYNEEKEFVVGSGPQYYAQNIASASFDMDGFGARGGRMMRKMAAPPSNYYQENALLMTYNHSEFHSFIKTAPLQKLNLTPTTSLNDQATFQFNCDLSQFSQLVLIAVDKESITQHSVDIAAQQIHKRDLRLLKVLNQDQGMTESRSTIKILKDEENFIEDISSTEVQLVDDLSKIHEILSEIRKHQGVSSTGFEVFDFVLRWHTLSTTEKDRYYSDYCCHELNLFVFKKDPVYFKDTVKPFIQSKMEKQFIDFYLLGQTAQVMKHTQLYLFEQLNALEQCLVVEVMRQNGMNEAAENLAKRMQLEHSARTKQDQNSVNFADKIFDLVLNLNSLSNENGGLNALKQQIEKEEKEQNQLQQMLLEGQVRMGAAPMRMMAMPMSSNAMPPPPGGPPPFGGPSMQRMAMAKSVAINQPHGGGGLFGAPSRGPNVGESHFGASVQSDLFDFDCSSQREVVQKKQDFNEVEATSEYMETHYYKQTDNTGSRRLVKLNQFWCDYAAYLSQLQTSPFMSRAFTDCIESDRSSFLALCVFDLPMVNNESHDFKPNEGRGVLVRSASNLLMFKKEIKACAVDLARNDIMVIHRYQELSQGNQSTSNQSSGKPDEFLARTAYACEVVITNVAPKSKSFNLLYQVPEGAVPLQLTKYMKSQFVSLQPYRSHKVVFHFYFPSAGRFQHFPSNISVNGVVTARGGANELLVVDSKRMNKIETFVDILHTGNKQDVLNFLKNENLYSSKKQFSFYSMLYLLKDKQFFEEVISILKDRYIFEPCVWQYAFFHKSDEALMRECLMMQPPSNLVYYLGAHFSSKLIDVDENTQGSQGLTKYLEYHPMVNSRTHILGQRHKILNATFRETYDKFLASIVQKSEITTADKMIFVYYLQLQDRMQEAIDLFNKIEAPNEQNGTLRIQYDYLLAYFDFFSGTDDEFKVARRIVQKYDNYPVSSWRMMFLTIADQLNEFDGEFDNEEEMINVDAKVQINDEAAIKEKRIKNKKDSKKREPQLNVEVDSKGTLKVESVNVTALSVKYYIINAELLFSRQPFLKDNTEGFSYVKAYHTLEHAMHAVDATEEQLNQYVKAEIPIPTKLVNQNMVIEITSADLQKFLTYYSNELKVNVLEQYGELKVSHITTGIALPRTYVKVFYQKKQGGEMFYRDGYTDIRGKIEYAQTSGDKLKDVKRFAILVQNDKYGSKILECDPPKEVTGNSQQVAEGGQIGMVQQKMARLQHRQQYANSKKK